jgi:PAS domain S-box-containing protein
MHRVLPLLLIVTAFLLTPALPAASKTVRIGVFDFEPVCRTMEGRFSALSDEGGLCVSLLQVIASEEKWDLEFVSGTLTEGMRRLEASEIDLLAAATYSKDSATSYDFTRETILSTWAQVYAHDKTHAQSWLDLAGKSIGIVRDDPYNKELRAIMKRFDIPSRFVEFEDYRGIFSGLESGWVDVGVVDRLYGLQHEKTYNVERTSIIFAPVELRFAAPKGRNQELIAALDYHLSLLKKNADSVYYRLMSKILGRDDEFKARKFMAWGLLVALAVAGFLAGMSLLLRIQVRRKTAQLSENYEKLKQEIAMRRSAESAIQENQHRFETLFEFAPESILVLTPEGRIIDCNKAAEELTGYSKEELVRMELMDLVLPGTPVAVEEIITGGNTANYPAEIPWTRKNGDVFAAQVSAKCLEMGTDKNILMIARDLTWYKKTEEELIKAQKLESVGVLAGGIAHDFNNILTAIMGNISLAKIDAGSGDPVCKRLGIAEQACIRAKDLTRQLLTFARGGAPVKETASIVSVIEESCRFALRGSSVGCELNCSEEVWPAEIDVGQVSQVINNIIINASQAMPNGGIIKVSAGNALIDDSVDIPLPPGRYVKVTIQDQGTGIPREHLSKVFDPYFTTKPTGNGLGLSSCYSIVRRHGGHVTLESEVGVGTTFHIYLPASASPLPEQARTESKPLSGNGKVLIMDDEDMIRDLLESMLVALKYEVSSARDGSEAVRLYRESKRAGKPFDLVIMDLTIPGGMGGREAIGKLLEIDPMVKAVVSSGYADSPILSEYKKYGFSGVALKPYRIAELSRILKELQRMTEEVGEREACGSAITVPGFPAAHADCKKQSIHPDQ